MLALKNMLMAGAVIAALAGGASQAQAHEGAGHYETRMQRVEEPGRWVEEQKVVETPGHFETRMQRVEVPGRWETVERRVWVEARVVPATRAHAEIGIGRGVRIGVGLPCTTVVAGHWETRCDRVWIEPRCETREVRVWVPGCRRVETVRVFRPGCVREAPVQVWVEDRRGCDERPRTTCGTERGGRVVVEVGHRGRRHGR